MDKKLLVPLLMAASMSVHAAGTLTATATGASTTVTGTSAGTCQFAQTDFALKLSQNVGASWGCSTTAAAVNAGSTKGVNSFGGGTSGGTVAKCSTGFDSTNGYGVTVTDTNAGGDGCS